MAVTIRNFSHKKLFVNTPAEFSIRILGGPRTVSVEGLPDGFYYDWVSSDRRVWVRGTPQNIVFDKTLTVHADDVVRRGKYSVYPLLPVYDTYIEKRVSRGVPFAIPVPVVNAWESIEIEGPWIGLRYRTDNYGFYLYGTIPEDGNFTRERFEYDVAVANRSGTVNGQIILTFGELTEDGVHLYILDGSMIRVFRSVALSSTETPTLIQVKAFTLPSIPGVTANYVALANDGTNLYVLHSVPQSSITTVADLDDQVVVVSPATANGATAGLLRRFSITRTSHYQSHDIEDFFYDDGKLFILTSEVTTSLYNSYFVREDIVGQEITRIMNLHARGGGIAEVQDRLCAVLFDRNSPNQGSRFRIYPPSWKSGTPLIADSHSVFTTNDPVAVNFGITTNRVAMTAVNNYVYILSSTLPNKLSTVEVPTPVNQGEGRNQINLDRTLSDPRGITAL